MEYAKQGLNRNEERVSDEFIAALWNAYDLRKNTLSGKGYPDSAAQQQDIKAIAKSHASELDRYLSSYEGQEQFEGFKQEIDWVIGHYKDRLAEYGIVPTPESEPNIALCALSAAISYLDIPAENKNKSAEAAL